MSSFLRFEHPHYAKQVARWRLAQAFYTGEGVESYLVQHKQGESKSSFQERTELADFHPLLGDILDSMAGIVFEKEGEVERTWGPQLGNPEAAGTIAHQIWHDCDGSGTNYLTQLRRLAVKLLLFNEMWVLVDGDKVKLICPEDAPNWVSHYDVLTKETVDNRFSITEKPDPKQQYVRYLPDRWERWRLTSDSNIHVESKEILIAEAPYFPESGRSYVTRSGELTAPIFKVKLPFDRYIAHQLAESHRVLYNNESDRDSSLRASSFPKLVISGDDEFFSAQVELLKKGANVLQRQILESGDSPAHEYIGPPTNTVDSANNVLDRKTKAFYDSAFRLFDAEGRIHQTATAAAMERSSGLASALGMIAETLAEAESNILWFLAQGQSDRERDWDVGAEWPTDYTSVSLTDGSPTQ